MHFVKNPVGHVFILFLLCCTSSISAQENLTQQELHEISSLLVDRLNNKGFKETLLVFDFTDAHEQPTELGAYLSGIFKNQLVNSSGRFEVREREFETKTKKKINFGRVLNKTSSVIKEHSNNSNTDDAKRARQVADGLEVASSVADNSQASNKRVTKINLKKIRAVVKGTITTIGDHYFLDVKVRKVKGDALIATASGNLTITNALIRLHGNNVDLVPSGGAVTGPTTPRQTRQSEVQVFRKLHLKFELIECIESGRYVECKLRITSEGKDTEVFMQKPGITLFNQDNGKEYKPVSINISDITHTWSVRKMLNRDTPVTSVITFEPGETVDVINRLEISCHSDPTKWFAIDFRDIFVE